MKRKDVITSTIYSSDVKKFHMGINYDAYKMLGSRFINYRGDYGTVFCVWAPNALKVGVAGDFNGWDAKEHMMFRVRGSGLWWLFIKGLKDGELYKYEIHTRDGRVLLKADPYARCSEKRPNTASIVVKPVQFEWHDGEWMDRRVKNNIYESPINIYEVHLGSWKRKEDGSFYSYREIADMLCTYVVNMSYTHVEVLPLTEHPLDTSWGYQSTGYFSVTSRYGCPEDFMYFVDVFHRNGIGVILDWVPGHFCKDEHGLFNFDGTSLYEYEDAALKENGYWGTANFDLAKPEIQSFLISNAIYWFEVYHIDGLRADAVTNMIFLNTRNDCSDNKSNSVAPTEFIKKLNEAVFGRVKNPLMIAEESSSYPLVTYPTYVGGLGFNYKWDMGWMNDTLKYLEKHPDDRKWVHNLITFSLMYTYSENFILPLSHDEVVHGKKSLLDKMPGKYEEKFANLRLLYCYMMCHPGKKLLFMGGEFGQFIEWDYKKQLDWFLLDYPMHKKMHNYVKELNHFYLKNKELWELDHKREGFLWIDVNNSEQSVISFIRYSKKGDFLVVICNFGRTQYDEYKVGVPMKANYMEVFNSDKAEYGGSNLINNGEIVALDEGMHGKPYCINIKIPALSALIFKPIDTHENTKESDE